MKRIVQLTLTFLLGTSAWIGDLSAASEAGMKFSPDRKTLIGVASNTIKTAVIPSGVTTIGDRAFFRCRNLTGMTIPVGVTSIGKEAFFGCRKLNVTIPASVTSIGRNAFEYVKSVKVADGHPFFKMDKAGALFDTKRNHLIYFPDKYAGAYIIPNGVTSINAGVFRTCKKLTSVTIPASMTSIGDGAFQFSKSLTSVTIPSSVTSIGDRAFRGCDNLTSVTIPSSVTSIGDRAFQGCKKLTSVTIPAGAKVGKRAFPISCKVIRK